MQHLIKTFYILCTYRFVRVICIYDEVRLSQFTLVKSVTGILGPKVVVQDYSIITVINIFLLLCVWKMLVHIFAYSRSAQLGISIHIENVAKHVSVYCYSGFCIMCGCAPLWNNSRVHVKRGTSTFRWKAEYTCQI